MEPATRSAPADPRFGKQMLISGGQKYPKPFAQAGKMRPAEGIEPRSGFFGDLFPNVYARKLARGFIGSI